MTNFGEYIKKVRDSKGMTLNQVALYSDISAAQLSRIETGKRGVPKPATIKKIAEALKVEYEELMEIAGYINENTNVSVAGQEIKLTPEEYKVFEELRKHPILFNDLALDPERKIKELIKLQKAKKLLLDDDEEYGEGFGDLED